jgi:hypothetical protein
MFTLTICDHPLHCKKGLRFPVPRRDVTLVRDIPAGNWKISNLFLQCNLYQKILSSYLSNGNNVQLEAHLVRTKDWCSKSNRELGKKNCYNKSYMILLLMFIENHSLSVGSKENVLVVDAYELLYEYLIQQDYILCLPADGEGDVHVSDKDEPLHESFFFSMRMLLQG